MDYAKQSRVTFRLSTSPTGRGRPRSERNTHRRVRRNSQRHFGSWSSPSESATRPVVRPTAVKRSRMLSWPSRGRRLAGRAAAKPASRELDPVPPEGGAVRTRNRTFQPVGCTGLPVLKYEGLTTGQASQVRLTQSQFAELVSKLPSSRHVSGHGFGLRSLQRAARLSGRGRRASAGGRSVRSRWPVPSRRRQRP
jgi:hypothetical protein